MNGFPLRVVGWPWALLPHYRLPLRNIATIAVFYALPVVQLVITYQTVSRAGSPGWSKQRAEVEGLGSNPSFYQLGDLKPFT